MSTTTIAETIAVVRARTILRGLRDDNLADGIQVAEDEGNGSRVERLTDERANLTREAADDLAALLACLDTHADDLAAALSDAVEYRRGELTDEELAEGEREDDLAGVRRAHRLARVFGVTLT